MCRDELCEWGGLCHPSLCSESYTFWAAVIDYRDPVKDNGRDLVAVCSCGLRVYDMQTMNYHRGKRCRWIFVQDYKVALKPKRRKK